MDAQVHHVVGHARSGTTLVRDVLGRHPEVGVTTELRFFGKLLSCHRAIDLGSRRGRRRYVEAIRHVVARNSGPVFDETWDGLEELEALVGDPELTHRKAFLRLAEAMSTHPEARTIVSKTPGNHRFPRRIQEHLPEVRFIHVVRDPRAVYASALGNDWDVSLHRLPASWSQGEAIMGAYAGEHPDRVLTVRYEDLTSDPEAVVPELAEFLGLPYDDAMLEVRDRNTSYEDIDHPGGIAPPHRRFRKTLTAREQATVRSLAEPWFSRRGYEAEADAPVPRRDRARHHLARARLDYDHRVMEAGRGYLTGRWGQHKLWRILHGLP